tara:strand:+ start:68 stop:412 length:345 start_codon:yes stop_codon:yes gene_type:complete
MGMIASVFRSSIGDCSMNGISSNFNDVTVVNVDGPFTPTEDRPAVMLLQGAFEGTIKVVPAIHMRDDTYQEDRRWSMFGGTYIATSDSRFSEKCKQITGQRYYGAVAFHDRFEA